ncbi:MAG: DUF262 domain-containing protein [Bacteroidia bacterium]
MKIDAEVKQVKSLKDYFFLVPDYQREYVWENDDHVARFLQDIYDEFDPNSDTQTNYFIGSTIIVESSTKGYYDVIDGQQRLTTIIITLCCMRASLSKLKLDEEHLEEAEEKEQLLRIISELLFEYNIQKRKKNVRLELQYAESKDYIVKLIEEKEYTDEVTSSISRMINAKSTISEFLQDLENNNQSTLMNFIRYFLLNVEMVIIQPDDIGSALTIFETINERGVGLDAMDLLKNLLFKNASENEFKVIKEIWKEIVTNLQNCGEGDKPLRFLRYFFIARYHDGVIREEEIYKWVISRVGKQKIKYETDPVKFAKEIRSASEKYKSFIEATRIGEADLNYPNLTGIAYLTKGARQPFILLLALKDSLPNSAIKILARNIESLMFYYAMNKVLTKYYESLFAELAVKIRSLKNITELKVFIESEFAKVVNKQKESFEAGFEYRNQGDIQPQYRIKYIFGKIDEYARSNSNLPSNPLSFYQSHQLEHILPQTGVNIPKEIYPEEYDYPNNVYKIGNLTLLEGPLNGIINHANDLSTEEWFSTKANAYKQSSIVLTRSFTENPLGQNTAYNRFVSTNLKHFGTWNKEKIKERQQMLKKLMVNTWSVDTN